MRWVICSPSIFIPFDSQESFLKILSRQAVNRFGDKYSPKLFTACLEGIFRKLSWESKGINIDGEHLTHLRFADAIVLI